MKKTNIFLLTLIGISFNSAERSWDCPCHGSRFDTNGQVVHGPASTSLPILSL